MLRGIDALPFRFYFILFYFIYVFTRVSAPYDWVLHEPDQVRVMGMMKQFILSQTTEAVTTTGLIGTGGRVVIENAVPAQHSGARL